MNWEVLKLLYVHEVRMLVRARRTVIMALIIPAVVMPIMLFGSKFANDQRQRSLKFRTILLRSAFSTPCRGRTPTSKEQATSLPPKWLCRILGARFSVSILNLFQVTCNTK